MMQLEKKLLRKRKKKESTKLTHRIYNLCYKTMITK
jgi:hypothetical protein